MEDGIILVYALVFLAILLVIVTVVGHLIWITIAWLIRQFTGATTAPHSTSILQAPSVPDQCPNCNRIFMTGALRCLDCGAQRLTKSQHEIVRDMDATLRELNRLHRSGSVSQEEFAALAVKIQKDRDAILFPNGRPPVARPAPAPAAVQTAPRSQETQAPPTPRQEREPKPAGAFSQPPFIKPESFEEQKTDQKQPQFGAWTADSERPRSKPIIEPPRKPFAEVLASFMEQSNIRWGEIVGGILIIGCSTALVISLWAQISRIPVLKFFIFTSVTAALFGVGFYTEHRWKLPTTSRGILTIASLLVPLNFLAIAAVSGGGAPTGALIIGCELIAPAIFLCLIYFAARIITPKWPHLLAAGVLGSSIGQLLIRHFAAPDNSPAMLLALGGFPIICYVASAAWMLRRALDDSEIDEAETNAIFISLGAITFAAALPFGLLLFRSGPVGTSMMHLAPLVTLAGTPMLASGALLWRRVTNKDLTVARLAGTSIALLGLIVVLSGMFLCWPNPASIIPAALLNFAVFSAIAYWLEIPFANALAAGCLTLAYVVAFHVGAGHIPWQNPRTASLLRITASAGTGTALALPFVLFALTNYWLSRKSRTRDAFWYLFAACAVAVLSLGLLLAQPMFGEFSSQALNYLLRIEADPKQVSAILALYSAGAFWFAWRQRSVGFTWVGTALLFLTAAEICNSLVALSFPWQATMLLGAAAATGAALLFRRFGSAELEGLFVNTLRRWAVAGAVLATLLLLSQIMSGGFEPSGALAVRAFWLTAIWGGLLLLNRRSIYLTAFQMTLTLGAVLATKSFLQRFDWYAFQPNAWLHPRALHAQGIVLGLICLGWILIRALVRRYVDTEPVTAEQQVPGGWRAAIRESLSMPVAFDHLLAAILLIGFAVLTVFGLLSGTSKEFAHISRTPISFDLAGFPHELIFGPSAWVLLTILLTVMLGNLWERRRTEFALGAIFVLGVACPLLAGRFESQFASASAWRWFAAIFLVVGTLAITFRNQVTRAFGLPRSFSFLNSHREVVNARAILLFVTLLPLLLLTVPPVLDAVNYLPARGPQSGFFQAIGGVAVYGVPLILAVLAFAMSAVGERSSGFSFAAGLLANLAVTVIYLIAISTAQGLMDRLVLVHVFQFNAIVAACVALLWMGTRDWWMDGDGPPGSKERFLLASQKYIAILLGVVLMLPIAVHLVALPHHAGAATFATGSLTGWLAVILTIGVAIAFDKLFNKPVSVLSLSTSLLAAGSLAAFGLARFGVAGWAGLHLLIAAVVLTAWLTLLARGFSELASDQKQGPLRRAWIWTGLTLDPDWRWDTGAFATLAGAIAVILALRGPFSDPIGAWWSVGALLAISALAASLNWVSTQRVYLYAAGILCNAAITIWLFRHQPSRIQSLSDIVATNIIVLSLTGVLWLWLELRARRVSAKLNLNTTASFHNPAVLLCLFALILVLGAKLNNDVIGFHSSLSPTLDWLALAALTILMTACLWDRDAKYAVAGEYLLGLAAIGTLLHQLNLPPGKLGWAVVMILAVYLLAVALVWRGRAQIMTAAARLGIPLRIDPETGELRWLVVFDCALIATIVTLSLWIELTFLQAPLRITAAIAVAAQLLTVGLIAHGRWQRPLRSAAIALFVGGVVLLGWSFLTPGISGTWLNRAVILMAAMFAIVGMIGAGLDKILAREINWAAAIRSCVPAMTIFGILSLAFVLGAEVYSQIEFGYVSISPLALLTVALTLIAGIAICIVFALSPRHDPLRLSESRRGFYVYAAEAMLALLFMHIRLTMPWLFTGFFERYWPLVVMAIAYVGITISELLRRRKVMVLARPIERTGALLPLLPVVGFWIAASGVNYSVVLLVVGGLYGLLSILRQSFFFGLLAACAGNGGLWYFLNHTSDYRFWQHPQVWLIPAALSVLVAAHLNRKDFSEGQITGIRYLALATIYVSSTADIFLNGVADSPWLPLLLAAFSIAGVFCGIIFRIRAFLLLGSVFLLLAIVTMINYASVNLHWTWLWYVSGIVTGALIITTFAVFEKKRAEVLRLVDGLKDWQR